MRFDSVGAVVAEMGSLRRMIDREGSCRARRPWSTFSTRCWSAMVFVKPSVVRSSGIV